MKLAAAPPMSEHSNSTTIRLEILMEGRMRKLFISFGFALLAAGVAQAQESRGMEVSGQYQFVRINPGQGAPGSN